MFPLRCWGERVSCCVAGAAEEEGEDVDFDVVGIEEGAELFDVGEAEPGVGRYWDLSAYLHVKKYS